MSAPLPGTLFALRLTDRTGDAATLRVLADAERDLAPHAAADRPWPLEPVRDGVLVDVSVGGRAVLPGAWVTRHGLDRATGMGRERVRPTDLRMPAYVLGEGSGSVLAWGETVWPLPFDDSVAIPAACRPGVHSLSELRRLVLVALDRRADIGLTLWQDPALEVPWQDVRIVPRARWWFEMAQVPTGMRYAEAARAQGVELERLSAGA